MEVINAMRESEVEKASSRCVKRVKDRSIDHGKMNKDFGICRAHLVIVVVLFTFRDVLQISLELVRGQIKRDGLMRRIDRNKTVIYIYLGQGED